VQWLIQNQDHHRRNTILSWLSQASPALRQSEVFNSHQKGTGSWLLQTDQFQEWISGEGQILFCPGIPGSGKTVLSSIIIDHLEQVFPDGDDIGIAYLFCDHRQQQTLVELYSALLRQAVQRRSSIPERIESLYESFWRKGTRPSAADILCELRAILAPCTRAFVILDALDECPVNDGNGSIRQPFLRELVRLQNEVGFNLLATSRPDQEIASHLQSGDVVEIRAREEDIRHYVDARLDDLPSFVRKRPTLQQHIRDSITETAKDMYAIPPLCLTEHYNCAHIRQVSPCATLFQPATRRNK
jgi:Cdc6-like AAA superfamily ATPase